LGAAFFLLPPPRPFDGEAAFLGGILMNYIIKLYINIIKHISIIKIIDI